MGLSPPGLQELLHILGVPLRMEHTSGMPQAIPSTEFSGIQLWKLWQSRSPAQGTAGTTQPRSWADQMPPGKWKDGGSGRIRMGAGWSWEEIRDALR